MSGRSPVEVSVVIPCHNSSAFLRETVASVVAQTAAAVEIVLIDDGSTDDTASVIERLLAEHGDSPMRWAAQANAGVAAARNRGIAMARGRYILPLDADDLIAATMIEACARILDAQPHTAVVFTDRQDFGELQGVASAGRFDLERLKYFNQIASCSMFRRQMWEAIGGYRLNVNGFDDWDFWLAATARGFQGHHLPLPLLQHRRRRGSQLTGLIDDYEQLYGRIILNNQDVYAAHEVTAARRFLSHGEPASLLRLSKLIFTQRHPLP